MRVHGPQNENPVSRQGFFTQYHKQVERLENDPTKMVNFRHICKENVSEKHPLVCDLFAGENFK
jgi:hypothetical protein